jgi:ATP-binding cassette subfamily B protein
VRVTRGEVEFRDVTFRYPGAGGDPVLSGIAFHLHPGETLGVLGGTGSGKSTLVHLIPRLYDVTGGQVLVGGVDVRDYVLEDLRAGIGMVLQDTVLFSGTIEDNLRWGAPDASSERLEKAASQAQAAEFIDKMPLGYASQIGQRGAGLSGGQRQRLSIARALVKSPPILILDDATSAVDTRTEVLLRQALAGERKAATTIIIAQRVTSVMGADRILTLEDGRISAIGRHEELLTSCPAYRELCRLQLGTEAV